MSNRSILFFENYAKEIQATNCWTFVERFISNLKECIQDSERLCPSICIDIRDNLYTTHPSAILVSKNTDMIEETKVSFKETMKQQSSCNQIRVINDAVRKSCLYLKIYHADCQTVMDTIKDLYEVEPYKFFAKIILIEYKGNVHIHMQNDDYKDHEDYKEKEDVTAFFSLLSQRLDNNFKIKGGL